MATSRLPYVVALDDVGRAVPVIPAKQVAVKDVRLQEAVVARWVTNLRTVIADAVAQRRLVDEVYAETGQNSPACGNHYGVLLEELAVRLADEGDRGRIR
jgi:type IV secretory pathway TrbF-like protein